MVSSVATPLARGEPRKSYPWGGRAVPGRLALARMARTGIYLVRGVPLELQQAARVRAVSAGTTLGQVLLKGLREYAAATWTPQRDDTVSGLKSPADRPQDLAPVVSARKSDRT